MILWKPSQSLCFSLLRHKFNNTGFWLRCFTAQWGRGGEGAEGAESKLESNKSQIPKSGYICSRERRSIKRGRGIGLHFGTHHRRRHRRHGQVEHMQSDSESRWLKKKNPLEVWWGENVARNTGSKESPARWSDFIRFVLWLSGGNFYKYTEKSRLSIEEDFGFIPEEPLCGELIIKCGHKKFQQQHCKSSRECS